jgi:hypothetical protein
MFMCPVTSKTIDWDKTVPVAPSITFAVKFDPTLFKVAAFIVIVAILKVAPVTSNVDPLLKVKLPLPVVNISIVKSAVESHLPLCTNDGGLVTAPDGINNSDADCVILACSVVINVVLNPSVNCVGSVIDPVPAIVTVLPVIELTPFKTINPAERGT